jgi:hypothetical protein
MKTRRPAAPRPEPTKGPPSRQDASPRAPEPFSVSVYLPGEPRPNGDPPGPTGTVELTAAVDDTGRDSLGAWMMKMARCCRGCGCRSVNDVGTCSKCGAKKDTK